MSARILVVDDEEIVIRSCERILRGAGYEVEAARSGAEALSRMNENEYDILVLDIMMPKMDGIEVLQRVKESHPDVEVIMVTGLAEIETAVRCMKLGALDYLPKPFDPDELSRVVARAVERRQLVKENLSLKSEAGARYRLHNIVGGSPRMQQVYRLVAQCAATNTTVLVTGESGTGKELIARAIHHNSLRKDKPFIAVDCNALSENLLESELFGHVKGAFTGAVAHKKGMFEVANGGTLFLDEIGNIPLSIQAKLLRVIQEREYRAVGDTRVQSAAFRLIAATNKDLKGMIAEGSFRDDLYYRINVFPIEAPPLRSRTEDIPALALHFLEQFGRELGKRVDQLSDGALNVILTYSWPGNVRELENTMHRAAILAGDRVVRKAHLLSILDGIDDPDPQVPRTGEELKRIKKAAREKSVETIERQFLLEALKRNGWNVTRAAEETGMLRANFQALMKKHGIRVREVERGEGAPDPDGDDAAPDSA
jgi:DNA-binding NtrC family response regulator